MNVLGNMLLTGKKKWLNGPLNVYCKVTIAYMGSENELQFSKVMLGCTVDIALMVQYFSFM